jgi:hypothetical protein
MRFQSFFANFAGPSAWRQLLPVVALCAAALLLATSAAAGAVLSFVPASKDVTVDRTSFLTLRISRVTEGLGAFDITLEFDQDVVSFLPDESSFGGPLTGDQLACPGSPCTDYGAFGGFESPDRGLVRLFEVSLAPQDVLENEQFLSFDLAQLAFIGEGLEDARGSTTLFVRSHSLVDAAGNPVLLDAAFPARLNLVPVTEPPMLWLLLSAIVAFGAPAIVYKKSGQGRRAPR